MKNCEKFLKQTPKLINKNKYEDYKDSFIRVDFDNVALFDTFG